MNRAIWKNLITLLILILTGIFVTIPAGSNSELIWGIPLFAYLVGLAFVIQWLVFIPAYLTQSEKFFDLTGSLTYIIIIIIALFSGSNTDSRSIVIGALVIIWAVRLGFFLFTRIQMAGKDDRFDKLKSSFWDFLVVWTLQGLWITLTLTSSLIIITSNIRKEFDYYAFAGLFLWLLGFGIEVISDYQKTRFKNNPANEGKFIQTGFWAHSRHPNYLGEILLWIGITIIALPVLQGLTWIGLITPVFVIVLLLRISGIPLLEEKADKKWGGQKDYEEYKKRTPVLIPRLAIKFKQ